jgi:hypothetical protein
MTDPFAADQELQDYIAAQTKEYSTWVATQDIHVGNALAYRTGDPVPISNVEKHGYDKQGVVAKTSSKAGKAATGEEAS